MMLLRFSKMHGLGNDMIVLNSLESGFIPTMDQARYLCRRRLAIGADQVLVLLPSDKADFRMLIFNSDGGEVEMCGNGIRCLARYIHDNGISSRNPLRIETIGGIIIPELRGDQVRVDMGHPVFEPAQVPVALNEPVRNRLFEVDGNRFQITVLAMGNPHCVIPVENVDGVPLEMIGPMIERHKLFPRRVNVEFTQVIDRSHIKVRVWERGAGATMACGTGACAAAVAMNLLGQCERTVTVTLPGGDLLIEWVKESDRVFMTGPAVHVFNGEIGLE